MGQLDTLFEKMQKHPKEDSLVAAMIKKLKGGDHNT